MKPSTDCGQEHEEAAVNSGECGTSDLEAFPKRRSRDPEGRRTRKPPPRSTRASNKSRQTMKPARVKRFSLFGFKSLFCPDCGANIRPFLEATICPCCARPLTGGEAKPHDNGNCVGATGTSAKDNIVFYCRIADEEKGPYTLMQLTAMWKEGRISADALHRPSDSSEWLPLLHRFAESQPLTRLANVSSRGEEQMAVQTVSAQTELQTKLASNAGKWLLGFAGILVLLVIIGTLVGLSCFSNKSAPSPGISTSQVTKSDVSGH